MADIDVGTLTPSAEQGLDAALVRRGVAPFAIELVNLADKADVADLAAIATSGSASDLTAGTIPAARFDDTAHGARAGGSLHPVAVAAGAAGFMSGADKTKLDGVATGATANSPDATLLARANHTGTQAAATISDFNAASRAQAEAALIAGSNVTITPAGSGATRTLTISASGGGGGSDSFETVNRNLAASDGTIAYSGGDIDTITYANGVVKTFAYGVDGLSTVTLSGATPGGIDLIKTFNYTLGEFTGFAYS